MRAARLSEAQPIGIAPPGTCCATSDSKRSERTGFVM
jgi:hypothetical protein